MYHGSGTSRQTSISGEQEVVRVAEGVVSSAGVDQLTDGEQNNNNACLSAAARGHVWGIVVPFVQLDLLLFGFCVSGNLRGYGIKMFFCKRTLASALSRPCPERAKPHAL